MKVYFCPSDGQEVLSEKKLCWLTCLMSGRAGGRAGGSMGGFVLFCFVCLTTPGRASVGARYHCGTVPDMGLGVTAEETRCRIAT